MSGVVEKEILAEPDSQYFEKMLNGTDRLIQSASRSWKYAIIGLVVAVVLSNLIWGIVHIYTISRLSEDIKEPTAEQTYISPEQTL